MLNAFFASLGASGVGLLSDALGVDSDSASVAAAIVGALALSAAAVLLARGERAYLATVAQARSVR